MNACNCPVKYDNEFLRQGICPFKSLANAMSVVFLSEAKNSLGTSNSYLMGAMRTFIIFFIESFNITMSQSSIRYWEPGHYVVTS